MWSDVINIFNPDEIYKADEETPIEKYRKKYRVLKHYPSVHLIKNIYLVRKYPRCKKFSIWRITNFNKI